MGSHHTVPCVLVAYQAGDHDIAPVHPHPHVLPRHEIRRAVVAEPPAELAVDPDPLAHGNLPRQFHVAVAPFGVGGEGQFGLVKEQRHTFPGNLFCCGVFGFLFHEWGFAFRKVVQMYQRPG